MELGADVAEPLDHAALDRRMHVLVRGVERERPGGDLIAHLSEGLLDLPSLGGGEQPRILESASVRDAASTSYGARRTSNDRLRPSSAASGAGGPVKRPDHNGVCRSVTRRPAWRTTP